MRADVTAALILAVIFAAVALVKYDFVAAAVAIGFIGVTVYPLRRDGRVYSRAVHGFALAGLAALVVLYAVDLIGFMSDQYWTNIPVIWMAELFCLPLVTFPLGFMVGSMFEVYSDSYISKRWITVFAIVFAMAVSGACIFTIGFDLWYTGQAFYNAYTGEYVAHLPPEIVASNRTQMMPATCATISVVLVAIVFRKVTRKISLGELCGGESE